MSSLIDNNEAQKNCNLSNLQYISVEDYLMIRCLRALAGLKIIICVLLFNLNPFGALNHSCNSGRRLLYNPILTLHVVKSSKLVAFATPEV